MKRFLHLDGNVKLKPRRHVSFDPAQHRILNRNSRENHSIHKRNTGQQRQGHRNILGKSFIRFFKKILKKQKKHSSGQNSIDIMEEMPFVSDSATGILSQTTHHGDSYIRRHNYCFKDQQRPFENVRFGNVSLSQTCTNVVEGQIIQDTVVVVQGARDVKGTNLNSEDDSLGIVTIPENFGFVQDFESVIEGPSYKDQMMDVKHVRSRKPRNTRVIVTEDSIAPGMAIATIVPNNFASLVGATQPRRRERFENIPELYLPHPEVISLSVGSTRTIEEESLAIHVPSKIHQRRSSGSINTPHVVIVDDAWPIENNVRHDTTSKRTTLSFHPQQWAVDRLAMLAKRNIHTSVGFQNDPPCCITGLNMISGRDRRYWLSSDPPGLVCFEGILFDYENLVKAQGKIRTWRCRKQFDKWKREQNQMTSALIIQNFWRRKYVLMSEQATLIQRMFRGYYARVNFCVSELMSRESDSSSSKYDESDNHSLSCIKNARLFHEKLRKAGTNFSYKRLLLCDGSCKLLSDFNHVDTLVDSILKNICEYKRKKRPIIFFDEIFERLEKRESRKSFSECLKLLAERGEVVYFGNKISERLSQVIILSKDWMSYILKFILRQDFFKELDIEKRYSHLLSDYAVSVSKPCDWTDLMQPSGTFPVVSCDDVRRVLLPLRKITKALNPSLNNDPVHNRNAQHLLFDFLTAVMIMAKIFIPCSVGEHLLSMGTNLSVEGLPKETKLFLPDHLEWSDSAHSGVNKNAWYRPLHSWEATICLSWSFGLPFTITKWGQMLAYIISKLVERSLSVKDMQCWKDAVYLVIGRTEISLHYESARDFSRLLAFGRGDGEFSGRAIWNEGGFETVLDAINRNICQVEVEKHVFCPTCLEYGNLDTASKMKYENVATAANLHCPSILCSKGHRIDIQLLSGLFFCDNNDLYASSICLAPSLTSLLPAIVQIMVWDDNFSSVTSLGSGFIVDAKRGFVVTAAHVIFHMDNRDGLFGKYRGTRTFIGIISDENVAMFRYSAIPVAKDIRNVDACVLRLQTSLKNDVSSINDLALMQDMGGVLDSNETASNEKLQALPITSRFLIEEQVRIFGFNQREDAVKDDIDNIKEGYRRIFCSVNVVKGYVCRYFKQSDCIPLEISSSTATQEFSAREELVIDCCRTLNGDSGGPCVNNEGNVIGILSRGRGNRSYVVPSSEIKQLIQSCVF